MRGATMRDGLCDGEIHKGRRRPPSILIVGEKEFCDACNEARLNILEREAIMRIWGAT